MVSFISSLFGNLKEKVVYFIFYIVIGGVVYFTAYKHGVHSSIAASQEKLNTINRKFNNTSNDVLDDRDKKLYEISMLEKNTPTDLIDTTNM